MQVDTIKFSEADKALLKNRINQLNEISWQQANNKENFLPTQDASFNIQNWLMIDSIFNNNDNGNDEN